MTDKERVWNALQYIEKATLKKPFVNLINYHWENQEMEDCMRWRRLLLVGGLIGLNDNQWEVKLTAKGILAKKSDFKDNGLLKIKISDYLKGVWTGLIIAIAGATLTVLLQWAIDRYLSKPPMEMLVLPQIQTAHGLKTDTIYVKIKK